MDVNFSSKLFNPLYWHLRKYMADPTIRYIFVYGGSSAAKTYTVVQRVLVDSIEEKDRYMVVRKYGSDIEDSIYADFTGIISDWDMSSMFTSIKNRIGSIFGGYVRFRGLDNSEKIKGIARFRRVILEEMTQFSHEDFKQIRKRLRGRPGQQIIGLWNPVSEEHWIKKKVLDNMEWEDLPKHIEGRKFSELSDESFVKRNKSGNAILIRTTYKDNYWITGHPSGKIGYRDEHVIADFEEDKKFDYAYYRVYALGEWGKLDTGAEFYKNFDVSINVAPVKYDPALPLHLSFDENVNPYLGVTIWQARDNDVYCIDEVAMEAPKNNLDYVLTEIKRRYSTHRSGVIVYGDATSRKADAKLQKGHNFFTIITAGLSAYNPSTRVPLSNPSLLIRGMFINQLFQGRFAGYSVTIGEHCKKTIEDIRYVKEASDGTKLKEKEKDTRTGVTFEKYSHLSDTMDYFLCFYFNSKYNEFQHGDSTGKRIALKAVDATNF